MSGAGKTVSYGDLVKNQKLNLTIPVKGDLTSMFGLTIDGDPPLKPVSQYTVVGKSFPNSVTVSKVTSKETWVTDVRLPGMLHARVVHPKTLGSKLISAGPLDKARFPNTRVVVKGNLVGVIAPTEWEAIKAAQQVASGTKWTQWKGLPGDARLFQFLKEDADWKSAPAETSKNSNGDVVVELAKSSKKLSASYQLPFLKHAPIGPALAVADVRSDGNLYVYTHTHNPQALRFGIAHMLSTSVDHVVVRTFAGPGHYGRSNGGNAGAEDEAVILSQAVGKPVRVQWMRHDGFQWSTQSSAAFSEIEIRLDAKGAMTAFQIDHYMPAMQDDRLVGAILAGLPAIPAPNEKVLISACGMVSQTLGFTTAHRQCSSAATERFRLGRALHPSASDCAITACEPQCSINRTIRVSWPLQRQLSLPARIPFSSEWHTRVRHALWPCWKPFGMLRDGNHGRSPLRLRTA